MSKRKILCKECPLFKDGRCPHKACRVSPLAEACNFGKQERRRAYSRAYRAKWRKEHGWAPAVYEPRTCPVCGNEFKPHRANQRYCSHDCSGVAGAEQDAARVRDYAGEARRQKRGKELDAERLDLKARLAKRDAEYARQFHKDGDMAATTRGRIPGGYSQAVNKSGLTVAI